LWLFGVAAIGWIIGPLLGYYLGKRSQIESERRKARQDFFSVLAAQKASVDALAPRSTSLDNRNEDIFFKESVEAMTVATYRVHNFITAQEWISLSAVLKDYQAHKEPYTGVTRLCVDAKSGGSFAQRLAKFMDRFDKCLAK
jgi:hypothetical protein